MDEVTKYEKYKPSGIDWIGDVPDQWKLKRFKNVARQISDKKSLEVHADGFIVALENIESETGRYIETSSEYETSGIVFKKDHLIYNKLRPYLNKVYLAERDGICVGDVIVLECLQMIPPFLKYLMASDGFCSTVTASSFGTKMPRTSWEFISNLKFGWPLKEEQLRIVNFLNEETQKLDTLISNKKVQVEKLKELRQIEINNAVTKGLDKKVELKESGIDWLGKIPKHWKVKRLKSFANIKYGLGEPPEQLDTGLPLIRATNVERGKIVDTDLMFVDPKDVPYDRDPVLKVNDIIVVRSGAYTGDSAIIPKKYHGAISGYDMVVRLFRNDPMFIAYGLLSNYILKNQLYLYRLRAAQPHLNKEELDKTLFVIPPPSEQIEISDQLSKKLRQFDKLLNNCQQQIEKLTELRKIKIYEAVTGKIKVPAYEQAIA